MIPEELCIGNLVRRRWTYSDTGREIVKDFQITEIRKNGETLYAWGKGGNMGRVEQLEPIPLTPEILEKNGFEFGYTESEEEFCSATGCGYPEEKGWCYDEGAGEIKIIFPTQSDGGLIRLDDQSFDRHLEIVYVKTIMVHQLQHALRLCGITLNIEV